MTQCQPPSPQYAPIGDSQTATMRLRGPGQQSRRMSRKPRRLWQGSDVFDIICCTILSLASEKPVRNGDVSAWIDGRKSPRTYLGRTVVP